MFEYCHIDQQYTKHLGVNLVQLPFVPQSRVYISTLHELNNPTTSNVQEETNRTALNKYMWKVFKPEVVLRMRLLISGIDRFCAQQLANQSELLLYGPVFNRHRPPN